MTELMTYTSERHEDGNSAGELSAVGDNTPDIVIGVELGIALLVAVASSWDENDDDEKTNDVEGRTPRVEGSNPLGRHAADEPMDDHDESREQEDLVGFRDIIWVDNGCGSENHGGESIVDRRSAGDLAEPIRPASNPGSFGEQSVE